MDFKKLILPRNFDITPKGVLLLETAEYLEKGYIANVEYNLNFSFQGNNVFVDYYGEDDTCISDFFDEEEESFHFDENVDTFDVFQKKLLNLLLDKKKRYIKHK